MSRLLRKTEFGNPILRVTARRLNDKQIRSAEIQDCIDDMYFTLERRKYGVGMAAPQVGKSLAISVIDTKPTPTRPELIRQRLTIINPEIIKTYGRKTERWEGCISGPELYATVPRYAKIRLRWQDQSAQIHENDFEGFMA
jgi:peptide deformylase